MVRLVSLFARVPTVVWLVLLGLGLAWAGQAWHRAAVASAVAAAVEAERNAVQTAARTELLEAQVEAHKKRTAADAINLEIVYAIQSQRDTARAAAGRAAGQRDSLLNTLAALRRGEGPAGDSAGPRSLADAAPQLADALGECGVRYTAVAGVADQLAIQVMGLQAFMREVVGPLCLTPSTPAQ